MAAQYFAESLPVALAGALGGVVLSLTLTPAIVSMVENYLPRAEEVAVDWKVLLFALAAAFLATALSSLAPLWQAIRTAPADVLGEGARASAGARSRRLSQSLVVAEIALAFGLLAVSAVLILHLRNLSRDIARFRHRSAPDLRRQRAGNHRPAIDDPRSLPAKARRRQYGRFPASRRWRSRTSCRSTAAASEPTSTRTAALWIRRLAANEPDGDHARVLSRHADSASARTHPEPIGISTKDLAVVVINQAAAKHYWGDADPVGAYGRFLTADGSRFQVVGVVGDVKNDGLGNPTVPEVYILRDIMNVETMHFVVRSAQAARGARGRTSAAAVQGVDPEQPIHDVATMQEIARRSMTLERAASFMTAFFAGAALLLAMLGVLRRRVVFGAAEDRGDRNADGAGRHQPDVLALVGGSGLKMAAYGVIAGGIAAIAAAFYLGRVFRIDRLGPAPFVYSASIVGVVAFVASALPAWRASLLSPMVAIRNEPSSMWQAARLKVHRAVRDLSDGRERPVVPLGTLITEFADSIRNAGSVPEATQVALATLRERAGAQSITLLERARDEYRCEHCSIPAEGFLLSRLKHYPHPMTLTRGDFEAWLRWAREFRQEHTTEIERLGNTGARIAVPLRTKNDIVGVLLLGPPEGRESYTAPEKQMLSNSGDVFALMIENARLTDRAVEQEKLRRDLALAAEVQRRLLPPEPPGSADVELAAFTLPARTVGGDYYDFLDLGDGRIGIAVADVSGKGIAAALLMSVVQASLRVISAEGRAAAVTARGEHERISSPVHRREQIRDVLLRAGRGSGPASAVRQCGHNPPYLVRRAGGCVDVVELSPAER